MRCFNVRAHNNLATSNGFTLVELLIVMMMVGILSAITAPSVLGLYNRTKANGSITTVQGALREAQRQAIRKSRNCTVTLDSTANMVMGSCLATGDRRLDAVTIRSSASSFQFNIKGAVTNSSGQFLSTPITIVLSSRYSSTQKCVVVSAPLGLIRTGTYNGSSQGTPSDTNCLPNS
ncbi:MAG TPA: type II secretion system protein [Crinalium sp.]|jgi:prepilin-type N-terminal cleavage/methylation domain-containing protein